MIVELEMKKILDAAGVRLYHSIPTSINKPYVIYDRISGSSLDIAYETATFALDVHGRSMEEALNTTRLIKQTMRRVAEDDDRFIDADIYNIVDNTIGEDIVYSVYISLLYRSDEE